MTHVGHHHSHRSKKQKVLLVIFLTALFMGIEIVYGFITNSLALIADGIHMFTDVAALSMTLFALYLTQRPATEKKTFGFYRAEILVAFINGLFLAVLSIGVIWSAIERLQAPPEVNSETMAFVALIGLAINIVAGFVLMRGHEHDLNIKAAFLHVVGDALASVGALLAAGFMMWKGWYWMDSVASLVISLIILVSAYRLISETVHLILQGVPVHLDSAEIEKSLKQEEGVVDLHHLHVWGLSSNFTILTVHLVVRSLASQELLERVQKMLRDKFEISHSTIQLEQSCLKDREDGGFPHSH